MIKSYTAAVSCVLQPQSIDASARRRKVVCIDYLNTHVEGFARRAWSSLLLFQPECDKWLIASGSVRFIVRFTNGMSDKILQVMAGRIDRN